MKAEINNENKAKFFALYYGQNVLHDYSKNGDLNTYKIEYLDGDREYQWLGLKPLSKISDEDAIDLGYKQCDDQLNFNYGMSPSGCFLDEMGDMDEFLSSDADYLRSRGYALPWMGISVEDQIEAGWVKLIYE
jgi:hypothetical protein